MYSRDTVFVSWRMQNCSVKINTELLEAGRLCRCDSDIAEIPNESFAFNTKFILIKIIFLCSYRAC